MKIYISAQAALLAIEARSVLHVKKEHSCKFMHCKGGHMIVTLADVMVWNFKHENY